MAVVFDCLTPTIVELSTSETSPTIWTVEIA